MSNKPRSYINPNGHLVKLPEGQGCIDDLLEEMQKEQGGTTVETPQAIGSIALLEPQTPVE